MKKAYISRYALYYKIMEVTLNAKNTVTKNGFLMLEAGEGVVDIPPKDWHETREEAVAAAEQMRLKEIEYHEKSIEITKNLKF